MTKYYDNRISIITGELFRELNYKDDRRHGLYKSYHYTGELYCELNYKDDIRHGSYKEYCKSGELLREENYKDGWAMQTQ